MISTPFQKGLYMVMAPILAAAIALPIAAQAEEEDTIKWRLQSHLPAASGSYEDSVMRVTKQLSDCTGGRLDVEVHPAGSLFTTGEIFNGVRRGVIQMGTIPTGALESYASTAGIASGLPFAFRDTWEAMYFYRHLGFEQMLRDEVAEYGVHFSTDKIVSNELVLRRPVESMADFQSLRLRSSGAAQRFLSEAGAAASFIPGPELYPSLSTGVVDGAHWGGPLGAKSMSLYEVAKYHVKPAIAIGGTDGFVINQEAIDDLPESIRHCVVKTLDDHFMMRAIEYQYQDRIALATVIETEEVQVNELPAEVTEHLSQVAMEQWDREAEKGPQAAKAVEMLKEFLRGLGYIQ